MQVMEQAREDVADAVKAKAPMHRKGSIKGRIFAPTSLKERLISRRQELNLSQGDVAKKITFWNNKQQEWKKLSRSAYCMYEAGEVVPDIDKIIRISTVLHCSPEWLAFGVGNRNAVEEIGYDAKAVDFTSKGFWNLDEDWVRTRFDAEPTDIVLAMVNDFSPSLKPGDMAVVRKDQEPNAGGGEYVFARDDEMTVAHVTRPHAGGGYRVYTPDLKSHDEIEAGELNFLGKVVGKLGDL